MQSEVEGKRNAMGRREEILAAIEHYERTGNLPAGFNWTEFIAAANEIKEHARAQLPRKRLPSLVRARQLLCDLTDLPKLSVLEFRPAELLMFVAEDRWSRWQEKIREMPSVQPLIDWLTEFEELRKAQLREGGGPS
jgi:hypothetical protein